MACRAVLTAQRALQAAAVAADPGGVRAGQTPLFKADSELEQLACIIGVRGTYDPEAWGGAAGLPDFHKIRFAPSPGQPLAALLSRASPGAVALLERCLTCGAGGVLVVCGAANSHIVAALHAVQARPHL